MPQDDIARREVIARMERRGDIKRKKIQSAEDFDGYEGTIFNIRAPNGLVSETQIVSPEMVYGKFSETVAREMLGEDLFNQIKQRTGLPAGKGHDFYERIRSIKDIDPQSINKLSKLKKESAEYYGKLKKAETGRFVSSIGSTKLDEVVDAINSGGITFDTVRKMSLGGQKMISVSVYPELSRIFTGKITKEDIVKYIRDNIDILRKRNHSLGGWYDTETGKIYLDVSVTMPDVDTAVALGKKYNQKAVFDLEKFEEIQTGGTGENLGNYGSILDRSEYAARL